MGSDLMTAGDVIEGAYLALLPSVGSFDWITNLPELFPEGIEWFDADTLHLTVRGGAEGKVAGRFANADLAHAATVRVELQFNRLEVLWGQQTKMFYLVLAPSDADQGDLAADWKMMGQTRPDFRIHLSLGRFSVEAAECLVPGSVITMEDDQMQKASHDLSQVITERAGVLDLSDWVFDIPHIAHFELGTPITQQRNFFPTYYTQGWSGMKRAFVEASAARDV